MISPDDLFDREDKMFAFAAEIFKFCQSHNREEDPPLLMASLSTLLCTVCQYYDLSKEGFLKQMERTWDALELKESK